jgi:hypothetical protein
MVHTGSILFDKYLGDALYAAMVYEILRLLRRGKPAVVWAGVILVAIELFQLTMIPARLYASGPLVLRLAAVVLGTHFSLLDLLAYAAGILAIYLVDRNKLRRSTV